MVLLGLLKPEQKMKISAESERLAWGLTSLTSWKDSASSPMNALVPSPNQSLQRKLPPATRWAREKPKATFCNATMASWSKEPCPIEFGAF